MDSKLCLDVFFLLCLARLRAAGSQKALILLERVPDLAVTGAQVAEWIEEVCDQLLLNLLETHQGKVKKQIVGSWSFFST